MAKTTIVYFNISLLNTFLQEMRSKTDKTASVLNLIETNKVKKRMLFIKTTRYKLYCFV